jgi:hypothetical protein
MSSLYEIDQEILGCIDPETGEIADFEKFDELQMQRETKIENIALWIKNLKAEAEMYKAEKQAFADRQKACESKADSLKKYLEYALEGTTFKTTKVAVSFRKTTSVEVDNVYDLPNWYVRPGEPQADKIALKKALSEGKEIEGAHLVEGISMSIK